MSSVNTEAKPPNPFGRALRAALTVLALALIGAGLAANEWLLAGWLSPDGVFSSRTLWIVRAFDLALLCAGGLTWGLRGRMAVFLTKSENAAALAAGMLSALALLVGAELAFWGMNHARAADAPLHRVRSAGLTAEDPIAGRRPLPSGQYTETVTLNGEPLFDATYTVDEHRCRVTLPQTAHDVDSALLFFGCSFTFGTGVADDETLPSQVAQRMLETRVYNFGGVGHGPHQMLALLQQGKLDEIVREKDVTVVYVFIPQHLDRSILSMRHAVEWGRNDPCFALGPGGSATYLGPVKSEHPIRLLIYDVLSREQVLKYVDAGWPPALTDRHIRYNAALVAAARDAAQDTLGCKRFIVLFYPLSKRVSDRLGVDWDHVKDLFEQAGLDVWDYRDFADDALFYPEDEHPRPTLHAQSAERLVCTLNQPSDNKNANAPPTTTLH
ncbi:MAG: hypothetical protein QG656_1268 [Candidatus Hydrogenedentes bacterium]|nr:hypothetical protein [Candidatus Hydrogenedentota bacterium]